MAKIYLIVHNVRSAHNVGSILRSADGLGVDKVFFSGYTPYPQSASDKRLPHEAAKVSRSIEKTALGAQKFVKWTHRGDISALINQLKKTGSKVVALEQTPKSKKITGYQLRQNTALIVGSEIGGLPAEVLGLVDEAIEIPMLGNKESYNVAVAAAIALYHLRFIA